MVLQLPQQGTHLGFPAEKEDMIRLFKWTQTGIGQHRRDSRRTHCATCLTWAKNCTSLSGASPSTWCSLSGVERTSLAHEGGGGGQYTTATGGRRAAFFSLS